MITRFHVSNYKALRDVSLDLTPIHVLIGPNDSGKTSILEAMAALCRTVSVDNLSKAFPGEWEGRSLVWLGVEEPTVFFEAQIRDGLFQAKYRLACKFRDHDGVFNGGESIVDCSSPPPEITFSPDRPYQSEVFRQTESMAFSSDVRWPNIQKVRDALHEVQLHRWVPSKLSLPVLLDYSSHFSLAESGFGLARFLDDLLGVDRDRFDRMEEKFCELFPEVDHIRLERTPGYRTENGGAREQPGKEIRFELRDDRGVIPASQASDGMMLLLAYLAILHMPKPPRLLLIEEPENGVHPARLKEVLQILRELVAEQAKTQVVMTTHSPYVVDQFKPDEVTLCQRGRDGAVTVHRLSDSKSVRDQIDIFGLGEIWTAEGDEKLAEPIPVG
jgi:predicted ATPase